MENEQPKTDLIADDLEGIRQIEMEGYELGVKKARNALFWTAGLIFIGEMIAGGQGGGEMGLVIGIALVEAAIFVALALWTKKKPYTAVLVGLCAFIGILLLGVIANTLIDGATGAIKAIFGGIIVKVVIIVILVRSLGDAKALQQALEENKNH